MKKFILLVVMTLSVPALFHAKLEATGEFRNRFAYMINKDQDSSGTNGIADFGIIDLRARIGLKLSKKDNPFSLNSVFEIGNITWGESTIGTSLGTDGINIETKHLYLSYKTDTLSGRVGLIPFSTPLGAELDDDLAGIKLSYKGEALHGELLYSLASAGSSTNLNDNPGFFALDTSDNADIYYGMFGYHNKMTDASAWFLRYTDNTWGNDLRLNYAGLYNELDLGFLKVDAGAVYNFGTVSSNTNISSLHIYAKAEVDIPKIVTVFGRFNMTTGNGGDPTNMTTIGGFQAIKGAGNLETDLSLLFGGSSFSQQAYFDDDIPSSYNQRNLTQGVLHNNDYGLMIIEAGIERDFELGPITWTPKLVYGMAYTMAPMTNGSSALGYEVDLHNELSFSKRTKLHLSVAMLLPGRALTLAIDNTFPGPNVATLGPDPAIKIDGKLEIKI